jgi:hypothetical protein
MKKIKYFDSLLKESDSYSSQQKVDSLIQDGGDLSVISTWVLHFNLVNFGPSEIAEVLPRMSTVQRRLLRDIRVWNKDDLDFAEFEKWCLTYAQINDLEVKKEFIQSDDFILYLKGRCQIYLFDMNEANFPDHDSFIKTDDDVFILKFSDDYSYISEIQNLLRHFYGHYGVEKAGEILQRVISESFFDFQEVVYLNKKERVREIGYVDYYEALNVQSIIYPKDLAKFVKKKISEKIKPSNFAHNHAFGLHRSQVMAFKAYADRIDKEMSMLADGQIEFILFNFSRLLNSLYVLSKDESLSSISEKSSQVLNLSLDYLRLKFPSIPEDKSIFDFFDFTDLYRVGLGLLKGPSNRLFQALKSLEMYHSNESFLGDYWVRFLDDLSIESYQVEENGQKIKIESYESYQIYVQKINGLVQVLPVITNIYEQNHAKSINAVNYKDDTVDFEVIMISFFVLFCLNKDFSKLELINYEDFISFLKNTYSNEVKLHAKVREFIGLSVPGEILFFEQYFLEIMKQNFDFLIEEQSFPDFDDRIHLSGVLIK